MKFVITILVRIAANITIGLSPTIPTIIFAYYSTAPVFSKAVPMDRVPTNNSIVDISSELIACFSVMTPITTITIAPIQAVT